MAQFGTEALQVQDGVSLYLGLSDTEIAAFDSNGSLPRPTEGKWQYFSLRPNVAGAVDRAGWNQTPTWYPQVRNVRVLEIRFTNAGYMHFTLMEKLSHRGGGWHHYLDTLLPAVFDMSEPPKLLYQCSLKQSPDSTGAGQ